nr:ORFA [Antholoba achates]AKQ50928.1 ORFA [Antholoba achates]
MALLPLSQINPEPYGLYSSFEQKKRSPLSLAPEVWARPSWASSVGALSVVEGIEIFCQVSPQGSKGGLNL